MRQLFRPQCKICQELQLQRRWLLERRVEPGAAGTREEKAKKTETGAGLPRWCRLVIRAVGRLGRQVGGQPELHGSSSSFFLLSL